MRKISAGVTLGLAALIVLAAALQVHAGDLDDGISKYTDESIAGDDNLGGKDTNISFIVTDAIAKSKMWEHTAQKEDAVNDAGTGEDGENSETTQKSSKKSKNRINYNDGADENNENSIVIGAGSQVDKVINVIIEK